MGGRRVGLPVGRFDTETTLEGADGGAVARRLPADRQGLIVNLLNPAITSFYVGVLPAFIVLWIRRAVPEPEQWHEAKLAAAATASTRWRSG